MGLRNRLLVSQLIVLVVAIASLAMVSRLYTPRYFVVTLERMELRGGEDSAAGERAADEGVRGSLDSRTVLVGGAGRGDGGGGKLVAVT